MRSDGSSQTETVFPWNFLTCFARRGLVGRARSRGDGPRRKTAARYKGRADEDEDDDAKEEAARQGRFFFFLIIRSLSIFFLKKNR